MFDGGKLEPSTIVTLYYKALYSGDLGTVKELMTKESYMMTLQTFGLRLALHDATFKQQLKKCEEDPDVLTEVEYILSGELSSRKLSPAIEIRSTENNGNQRQSVEYTEDGKSKKLYFSKEDDGWKINYYAGRKVG
jgi:hypothetical protein